MNSPSDPPTPNNNFPTLDSNTTIPAMSFSPNKLQFIRKDAAARKFGLKWDLHLLDGNEVIFSILFQRVGIITFQRPSSPEELIWLRYRRNYEDPSDFNCYPCIGYKLSEPKPFDYGLLRGFSAPNKRYDSLRSFRDYLASD
jgi:hypothetical protein